MPGLARLFLPGMAVADRGDVKLQDGGRMCKLGDLVEGTFSEDFPRRVGRVFLASLQVALAQVHDPAHLQRSFCLPGPADLVPPGPPALPAAVPAAMAELFEQEGSGSLWPLMAQQRPEAVVGTAVTLASALTDPALALEGDRLRALHSLWLWLDMLETQRTAWRDEAMAPLLPALALCPATALLHLLHAATGHNLLRAGLLTLQRLLHAVTPVRAAVLRPVLFSINYCLVTLATEQPDLAALAISIIDYLFIKNGFRFPDTLEQLEDYPPGPPWAGLQAALAAARPAQGGGLGAAVGRWLAVAEAVQPAFLRGPVRALLGSLRAQLAGQEIEPGQLRRLFASLLPVVRTDGGETGRAGLRCLGEVGPLGLDSPLLEEVEAGGNTGDYPHSPEMKYIGQVSAVCLAGPDYQQLRT
jgi:hypothetical protein